MSADRLVNRESIPYIFGMEPELSPEERSALTQYVREKLKGERFWLAPRLKPIKAALMKLDTPMPAERTREIPRAPKLAKAKARR
jgi:hypothetical protein